MGAIFSITIVICDPQSHVIRLLMTINARVVDVTNLLGLTWDSRGPRSRDVLLRPAVSEPSPLPSSLLGNQGLPSYLGAYRA